MPVDAVPRLRQEILAVAQSILNGKVSERQGAARIWVLLAEADYPEELHDARVAFVGPLSEMQDHPEQSEYYEAYIRKAAERFAG